MKKSTQKTIVAMSLSLLALSSMPVHANGNLLTGDTKLACEAILCLSSGIRPGECNPSLKRYFSINHKYLSDTIQARLNFLNLCPSSSDEENHMPELVKAIAHGAGRCDAAHLNKYNKYKVGSKGSYTYYISSKIPKYCQAYAGNKLTHQIKIPKYVCPNNKRSCGGFLSNGHFVD